MSDPAGPAGSAKTAIQRLTFGLPLPAAGDDGLCAPSSSIPTRYGYNASVSCGVELTGAQLQSFCTCVLGFGSKQLQDGAGGEACGVGMAVGCFVFCWCWVLCRDASESMHGLAVVAWVCEGRRVWGAGQRERALFDCI